MREVLHGVAVGAVSRPPVATQPTHHELRESRRGRARVGAVRRGGCRGGGRKRPGLDPKRVADDHDDGVGVGSGLGSREDGDRHLHASTGAEFEGPRNGKEQSFAGEQHEAVL